MKRLGEISNRFIPAARCLKNEALYLMKFGVKLFSSIETIGKNIMWLITMIVIAISLCWVIHDSIQEVMVIEIVNLPDAVVKTGLTSETFTENILINIRKLVLDKNNGITYADKLIKDNNLGGENCENSLISKEYVGDIARKVNVSTSNSENIKIFVPETNISLNKISNYVKDIIRRPNIILQGSIIENSEKNGFIVQVVAKYNSQYSHKSELVAKNIHQAEDLLTILTLKYINPAMFSYLMFDTKPEQAVESISLGIDNLPEFKNNSSPITLLGYFYLNSDKPAERDYQYELAKKYFKKAIYQNPDDDLAILGLAYSNFLLADVRQLTFDQRSETAISDIKTLNNLISNKQFTNDEANYAYLLIAQNYKIIGNEKLAKQTFETAIKQLPNQPKIYAAYINYLIETKEIDVAENVTNKVYEGYIVKILENDETVMLYPNHLASNKDDWMMHFSKLQLLLAENKFDELSIYSGLLNNCGLNFWLTKAIIIHRFEKDQSRKKLLQRYISSEISTAERNGLEGFNFYESWADFLYNTNQFDEALLKYKKALEFQGEHRWTLLNISNILSREKKFKEAETYAKKSLSFGIIPQAITNYLSAILNQRDYKRFLHEYAAWRSEIYPTQQLNFLTASGVAECNVGNKVEARDILEQIKNKLVNETEYQRKNKSEFERKVQNENIEKINMCLENN